MSEIVKIVIPGPLTGSVVPADLGAATPRGSARWEFLASTADTGFGTIAFGPLLERLRSAGFAQAKDQFVTHLALVPSWDQFANLLIGSVAVLGPGLRPTPIGGARPLRLGAQINLPVFAGGGLRLAAAPSAPVGPESYELYLSLVDLGSVSNKIIAGCCTEWPVVPPPPEPDPGPGPDPRDGGEF